jgi:hypothetical protein
MKQAGIVAVLLLVSGCATSAPDRSARTASTLESMQQNSMKARQQIDAVSSSLEALLSAPPEKLRTAYDRYDRDVNKMNEYAQAIRDNDSDLRKNGGSYLNQWQKDASSVSNPELRAIAEQRRNEIGDKSRAMSSTIATAAQSFAAYLRDIEDIRKVIGNDLTPTTQANVKGTPVAQSAQQEGEQVKGALLGAEQAISDMRAQITPTGK